VNQVFVDTVYWVATVKPGDQWADAARSAKALLGAVRLVTTDEVLSEFLAALSAWGPAVRQAAVAIVRAIYSDPNVRVIPQTRETFLKALERYEGRLDKEYSLTDCSSMNAMDAERITQILTHDHHFAQEGFVVLITQ